MAKHLKSLLLPARNDARATLSGIRELSKLAANEERPAVGFIYAIQYSDNHIDYGHLGLAARNSDRAARLANQLADKLVWDK